MIHIPHPAPRVVPITVADRYDNFIGGKWMPPVHGEYMTNLTPATGGPICQVAKSDRRGRRGCARRCPRGRTDWNRSSQTERAAVLEKIADAIDAQPRDARHRRELGERQAGPRDAERRPAPRRRPLPLLRGRRTLPWRAV